MAAFSKIGLPVSQVIQDATNGSDFEMVQAALESVSYLAKKEQLQILHQLETYISQNLEFNRARDGMAPERSDLMVKYVLCKELPPLLTQLLLISQGSSLMA